MQLQGNLLDYFIVFGSGVLVSFTPCIYPVLPVTVASIAAVNVQGSRMRGFLLSLLYVFGVAVSYSTLAAAAVLTGKVFGTLQQASWVSWAVAGTFLFFALIMFDVLPFVLGFDKKRVKPTTPWAVFMLGLVSGFIVGPCTAPILGSLLFYVGSKQNLVLGISLIFVFAYGMGASLILAGTFSGAMASFPKSGAWMLSIKRLIGVAFLIAAGYYFLHALRVL